MKKINWIVISVTGGAVIAYVLFLVLSKADISSTFYSFTLTDIADNIITLLIGVLIASVFGVYFTNKHKQYELVASVLDMYLNDLKYIMRRIRGTIDMDDKDFDSDSFSKRITHLLRLASNDLSMFCDLFKKCNRNEYESEKYKKSFFYLKKLLTDSQFESRKTLESTFNEILDCYYSIKNDIHLLKLSFYK